MERTIKNTFLLLIFCCGALVSASQTDVELAEYYYANGEYEQAKLYYEKIWKNNKSNKVYENYLNSLIALEEFDEAETIVKKKLRTKKDKATAHSDLGSLYLKFDKLEDAHQQFDLALKALAPGRSPAVRLANSFVKMSEFDYALRTYEKAQKISTDGYGFHYEMGNLNGMMGNHEGMVDSFLSLLKVSPNYIQTIQNSLNRNLGIRDNDEHVEMLRTKLLKAAQKSPDDTIYSEMLIWLFIQQKDFDAAIVQGKAIDKRLNENGARIMDIADMASTNKNYDAAITSYEYVISKGENNIYYHTANTDLLQVMLEELVEKPIQNEEDFIRLEKRYEETISRLGKKAETAIMLKELAHLKGFYLGKSDEAIALLEESIELPGVYPKVRAVTKLELGDIFVLEGLVWDASLLYSQVELEFKEDIIGHEAKYRNAKISYYTGDFDWAQAQLDVLKASTSKLISNDAIELSLLITDNFAMDTIVEPMMMYAKADLLNYQNRLDEAVLTADSIITLWPAHTLKDEVLMLKAQIQKKKNNFEKASEHLQEIIDLHFTDILADNAIFELAEIKEGIFQDQEGAKTLYEKLILEYPGSLFAVEARKRFRLLRGDSLE